MNDKSGAVFKQKKLLFFMFLLVFLLVGFFTFFSDLSFTGNLVKEGASPEEGLEINGNFTVPILDLNSEFEEVVFVSGSDSVLFIENLDLGLRAGSEVVLRGFDGRLSFDDKKISSLKGKAGEVVVNGEYLSSRQGETKIHLSEEASYSSLSVGDNLFLRKLDYFTSGILRVNEDKVFSLDNESLNLNDFYGSVSIEEGVFEIEGVVDKLELKGRSDISIS